LAFAKDCITNIGQEECVAYYRGSGCESPGKLGSYVPTCGGNCFQFNSFDSLSVKGNDVFGTDCHIYSDINCQHQIGDTGNHKGATAQCINVPGAQSMKCFFNC
ncbi:hypothetical protein B0H19DRAFT_866428, partial [Mycena capillaripes]